jgi:hypothetical protein
MAAQQPAVATSKTVRVVTSYVDLGLVKRPAEMFHEHGRALTAAVRAAGGYDLLIFNSTLNRNWLWRELVPDFPPPANARAEDRFANEAEHLASNIIQHAPVHWLKAASECYLPADIYVWLGYTILKQGAFTGKPVLPEHITDFIARLSTWDATTLPFPGMTPQNEPVNVHGDNWRFCGSTIIVPRQFLPQVEKSYKACTREFIRVNKCVPIDLAIWPTVEKTSGLPWRWYKAEYDSTQFTNFPFN